MHQESHSFSILIYDHTPFFFSAETPNQHRQIISKSNLSEPLIFQHDTILKIPILQQENLCFIRFFFKQSFVSEPTFTFMIYFSGESIHSFLNNPSFQKPTVTFMIDFHGHLFIHSFTIPHPHKRQQRFLP